MLPVPNHSFPIRVYYEDTDAGGVVYHANYIAFAERARTEWLRTLGFEQRALQRDHRLAFPVTRIHIDYLKPARLDDMLTVATWLTELGRATIRFRQEIRRGDAVLAKLDGAVACVELTTDPENPIGRVARIPEALYNRLAS